MPEYLPALCFLTMGGNRVINNVKWVVICKTIQSITQLMIGMLTARYLGPDNYGLINYAKSVIAFAVPFMRLGLDITLTKELVDRPEQQDQVMGTALVMEMLSSLICLGAVTGFVSVFNRGEPQTIAVCVLYGVSLFFQAVELIQYWFHSNLKSKYPSVAALISYGVVSIIKIYFLISSKSVYWFAIVYSIEYGIVGFLLLIQYFSKEKRILKFSFPLAKKMYSRGKYYIWAALMVSMFQNTDHVMLKLMVGNEENGYYTAAITAVGVVQFVYMAIIDSVRVVILENKKNDEAAYQRTLSGLYGLITYMSLIQSVAFIVLAKVIINILYGSEYMAAVPILRILVWYVAFSFMGIIRNIWILAEEKQSMLWKINLIGALLNILLNAVMIPLWSACGAAMASVLTQIFTNFLLGFIYKPLRENNRLMLSGMYPRAVLAALKKII